MTDITHALPDVREAPPVVPATTFSDLLYAHFTWFRSARNGHAEVAATEYRDALKRFEAEHGRLVRAFWCTHLESGIALTERKRRWRPSLLTLHRETDWATKGSPDIATQLHRCDDLAIRARTVLTGVRQRICLELVASSAAHLLSLVDRASAPAPGAQIATAVEQEKKALDDAEKYYKQAANGQAEIIYFAGMATVAVVVSLAALLFLHFAWSVGVAAAVAGAVGAVVSVIQRINAGSFRVHYDVGRPYAFFLGGLRPMIGAAFAIAIAFTFASGLIDLPLSSSVTDDKRMALVVISFMAGFSERWAKDTLSSVVPHAADPPQDEPQLQPQPQSQPQPQQPPAAAPAQ